MMVVSNFSYFFKKYIMNSMEVIFAVGGTSSSGDILDTAEVFLVLSELWSDTVHALPRTIVSSSIVNINQRMHLIGGLHTVYPQKSVWVHQSDLGWRRSSITLEKEVQGHVATTLKTSEISFKGMCKK